MTTKTDLHTHSIYSDGAHSVYELLKKAKSVGMQCIAITDHDTLKAIPEGIDIANDLQIELIPGLEISTEYENREVHILGYFIDIDNQPLQNYLANFRLERIKRAKRIVEKLNHLGINVSFDDVLENSNGSLIARNHIAQALLKKKYVSYYKEAFEKYIGDWAVAYEKKIHLHPKSIIKLINEAKGISVLAHPQNIPEHHLKFLIDCGLDGIEVLHPSHSNNQIQYFKKISSNHFLLETGGSDYHGGFRNDDENLGKFTTQYETVISMKNRLNK